MACWIPPMQPVRCTLVTLSRNDMLTELIKHLDEALEHRDESTYQRLECRLPLPGEE